MAGERVKQYRDGIPVNPNDWTVEDWKDLYLSLEFAKARIRKRHEKSSNKRPPNENRYDYP